MGLYNGFREGVAVRETSRRIFLVRVLLHRRNSRRANLASHGLQQMARVANPSTTDQ